MLYKCIEQVVPEARAKKLKDSCRTRWVERIDSYAVFLQLLPAVNNTLLAIVNPNECLELGTDWAWDGETITKQMVSYTNFNRFKILL